MMCGTEKERNDANSTTVEEWWDRCHKTAGSFYVSDYGGPTLWSSLNISDRIVPGKSVLEIGVGGATDIRELHAKGLKVHVLDITPTALQKVEAVSEGQWLESQIELLPKNYFDVAISHLVTQHINNEALSRQIRYVLRSLKPRGVFAVQFADHINGMPDDSYREDLEAQQKGGVCRSLRMIRQVVDDNGGKIVWVSQAQNFPDYGARWFYVHMRRKKRCFLSLCGCTNRWSKNRHRT